MWKLAIEDDEGKRIVVPLTLEQYTIGRKDGNTIRLTERNVSREHARLFKKNGNGNGKRDPGDSVGPGFVVEDLTSYNGVFVNGLRVTHAQALSHGDLVQIGDYRIVLQDEAPADAPPPPLSNDVKQTVPGVPSARAASPLERPNRLIMLAGPTPGSEHPLNQERLTIGRAEDAGISVNHNSVSRIHCEVNALDDGRFEIIDKESSNGVRVNGTDLRRGIVESGDIIELGDVQFKFVGAGQTFRPSQAPQLAALANREATDTLNIRRRSNALPITIFAVVVVAGTLGAWAYTRRAPEPHAAAAGAHAPLSPERVVIEDAKSLCAAGDVDSAHAKLAGSIAEDSPLRGTQDFRDIETKWADQVLARADAEGNASAKAAMYQRVSQDMGVDPSRRKAAADKLQQLETVSNGLPPPTQSAVAAQAAAIAMATGKSRNEDAPAPTRAETTRRAAVNSEGASASASSPPPQAAPASKNAGADDRERQLALQGTQDSKAQLKQQLEQRVANGKASEMEVRLLVSTCKDLGDRSCVQSARAALTKFQQ